ncbi:MAG: hypothetical protein FWC56_01565, partial [Phycisphaerae bacterium]|nr:hypothetical protein [Phycisphaerae bacterium]
SVHKGAYKVELDLASSPVGAEMPDPAVPESADHEGRPWIGIQFECCSIYTRIYRNRSGTAYEGRCPRCSRPIRLRVGPGGTNSRMFRAQ